MRTISFAELLNFLFQLKQEVKGIQTFKSVLANLMNYGNSKLGKEYLSDIDLEAVRRGYKQVFKKEELLYRQINDLDDYLRRNYYSSPYNLRHVINCLREESGLTVEELCERLECSLTEWELLVVDGHCSHQLFYKISRFFNVPKFEVYDSWYLRVKEDHQKLMSLAEREECTVV
ncbi:hypothetical protein [Lysinibacillus fusiformis]|uniref:hypothetical protein n=1 Tax=Lysinibacillus fusiformis TaxID=28031 RepID=UPI00187E6A98|nr:hypothetical protein [Lysinibacillus fusiformis]MBD8523754.1 hypothetical protein [Lysinibacillus fusiformis]